MRHYPVEHKKAVFQKWANSSLSLRKFAKDEGIGISTLYDWKTRYLSQSNGELGLPKNTNANNWTSEQNFAVVMETASLSEAELSEYCRRIHALG